MGMFGASIDPELGQHLPTERVAGHHAANCSAHDAIRMRGSEKLIRGDRLDAAHITSVAVVGLVLTLATREGHLLGVDHDDVVTSIRMRREGRLVLAA